MRYAHDILGDLEHGMQRWIDWNLIVDKNGGPRHVPGGFAAPLVATDTGGYVKTVSYAYIRQIASTIQPGAVRIGSSVYGAEVDVTAARNKDGSVGVVLLNKENHPLDISIRMSGYIMNLSLPGHTLSSVRIEMDR